MVWPILGVCSGIKVDLFVNGGFNRQSLCPSVSWHLALLQLGVLRAVQAVQSCLWPCSRIRFSLSLPSEQRDDDGASGGLVLLPVQPHFGWGSQGLQSWPFTRATWHLSLLSAAASASLYLTELFQSQPLLLWRRIRQPLSPVTWLATRLHLIMSFFCRIWSLNQHELVQQEQLIPTSLYRPGGSWMGFVNRVHHNFYSKSTWGAIHLCHPGGTVRKPWVAPRVSNCSYSHPLEMSRKKLNPVNREMHPLQSSTFLSYFNLPWYNSS